MGVVIARADKRLIHGQVAMAWLRRYPVNVVIVIDDESAGAHLKILLLQMAVSGTIKCVVTTVAKARQTVERYAKSRIFLYAKEPGVFLKLLREGI